jgi:hypothetical protein
VGYLINIVLPRRVEVANDAPAAAAGDWIDSMEAFAAENIRHSLDLELEFTSGEGI